VLLLGGAGDVRVGTPVVNGARVLAEVLEHGRDKKVRVFKYKNKTRYRRRFGHRQDFTRVAIRQILTEGEERAEAVGKPKRPARKKAGPKAEAPAAEAAGSSEAALPETVVAGGVTAAEAAPAKPRRARTPKPRAEASAEETPQGE